MAILKKKPALTAESFINAAPDAPAAKASIKNSGNKKLISVTVTPELLQEFDAWAKARSMSRAAGIGFAMKTVMDQSAR
jgi:hypothetical protein